MMHNHVGERGSSFEVPRCSFFVQINYQMAHVASKRVSLDDIWPDLENGITSLVTNLNAGFPRKRWMELYSYPIFFSLFKKKRPFYPHRSEPSSAFSFILFAEMFIIIVPPLAHLLAESLVAFPVQILLEKSSTTASVTT